MPKRDLSALFGMEPKEAVVYLQKKKIRTSWDYREIWGEAHHRTFTVAKIMKADLLRDIHDSLTKALKDGTPFKEWHKQLKPTLIAKGWYGRTEVFNPDTGEFKTITVGSRRLKTIYETNMRSAYNYGRYQHLRQSGMPYWMYVSALLPTTRDTHRAMHGAVYPKEHPFWSANYPPNGYNCKCKVRGYTEQMLKQRGIKPREHYETIADPGFTHSPATAPLSDVWGEKILNAPASIKDLERAEKRVSDMYDAAFDVDPDIRRIMRRKRPVITIHERDKYEGFYVVHREVISFWHKPVSLATLRHESGHRLDHVSGWISRSIQTPVIIDGAALKRKNAEISKTLKNHEDDMQLQDLFYLSSKGEAGYIVTREDVTHMTQSLLAKEAFANFFQFYLLGDTAKLAIIQTYFPNSYAKFIEILSEIKDQS